MNKSVHRVYIGLLTSIVIIVSLYLFYTGFDYYNTSTEERFYHPHHDWFKPSGIYGHGIGILGTAMILFGVVIYIARKRYNFLSNYIRLKYLLEFHIFLCTLGPILILFHTSFKFGGIVSIAFWSMCAVVLSGMIGRFIYIQIPRTIEGRELSLDEVIDTKLNLAQMLNSDYNLEKEVIDNILKYSDKSNTNIKSASFISSYFQRRKALNSIKRILFNNNIPLGDRTSICNMLESELTLSNKITRLETMQKLFKYWHVAHLPFALIMLIIVVIHVAVTLLFGYKWIF